MAVQVHQATSLWGPPSNAWLESVGTQINILARQAGSRGWDGGDAAPVTTAAVRAALTVLEETMCADTVPPAMVPTVDGGLQMEWHCRGVDLEVYVEANGAVSAWGREGSREWENDHYSPGTLSKELSRLTSP